MLERLSLSEVLELLDRIPRGTPLFAVQLETVFLPCKECGAKSGKNGRLTKEFDGIVYTAPCPKCSTQELREQNGLVKRVKSKVIEGHYSAFYGYISPYVREVRLRLSYGEDAVFEASYDSTDHFVFQTRKQAENFANSDDFGERTIFHKGGYIGG